MCGTDLEGVVEAVHAHALSLVALQSAHVLLARVECRLAPAPRVSAVGACVAG